MIPQMVPWNSAPAASSSGQSSDTSPGGVFFLPCPLTLTNLDPGITFFFLFFFWPRPQHLEIPEPRIKPKPQQQQCRILSPLGHQGTPGITFFITFLTVSGAAFRD